MSNSCLKTSITCLAGMALLFSATVLSGQVQDPGPRPAGNKVIISVKGPALTSGQTFLTTPVNDIAQPTDGTNEGAGQVLGNSGAFTAFWFRALAIFGDLASANGSTDPATQNPTLFGLGPAFNGSSCFMCHSFPAIGGTSLGPTAENPNTVNPELVVAHERDPNPSCINNPTTCATNPETLSFLDTHGPIREARFIQNPDGSLDGSVHELFSIEGRTDAPTSCELDQPDFATQVSNNNLIFRIPTPTFGVGIVEAISDGTLISSFNSTQANRQALNIGGHFNTNGNDQTITRFGWKAQNKSLLLFAAEAANVEMGVTNEIFQNERTTGANCLPKNNLGLDLLSFDDTTHANNALFPGHGLNEGATDADIASIESSAIENFAIFMRFNGTASQCLFDSGTVDEGGGVLHAKCDSVQSAGTSGDSFRNGQAVFNALGCQFCHTQEFHSDASSVPGIGNRQIEPFSDFALHHMGSTLADGVTQGAAGPDEFRTAPLWGLGQRIFLLHDGRTTDLLAAIQAHFSHNVPPNCTTVTGTSESFLVNGQAKSVPSNTSTVCDSEANAVITNFNNRLQTNPADIQDLLNFLRSL